MKNKRLYPVLVFSLLLLLYLVTLKPVFIFKDGQWIRVLTHGSSVGVVLREAGLNLGASARTVPGLDAPVSWGMTVEVWTGEMVEVIGRGQSQYLAYPVGEAISIEDWLSQGGIDLAAGEWIFIDGVPTPPDEVLKAPPHRLELRQEVDFIVDIDGQRTRYSAPGPTVGEALFQVGIPLYVADQVTPPTMTRLDSIRQSPMVIEVRRSRPISIHVDGKELNTRAAGRTVGEALSQAGVGLTGLDYSVPDEAEPLPADGKIRVVRVREEILREQSALPFTIDMQPVADLELDQTRELQPGAKGILESVTRVRYEDGVEVSRTSEGSHVLLQPRKQIVGYGTKVVIRTVDTPDGTVEYWRAVKVYATSYSPCRLGVTPPRCGYITASGKTLAHGMIAVTWAWFDYMQGESVYVEGGYGYATIEDVGEGFPDRHWIDQAYLDDEWVDVSKWVILYFLTPQPETILWVLP